MWVFTSLFLKLWLFTSSLSSQISGMYFNILAIVTKLFTHKKHKYHKYSPRNFPLFKKNKKKSLVPFILD